VRGDLLPLALALRAARTEGGITQRDLAQQLGISLAAVSHWELGTRPVPCAWAVACARVLQAPSLLTLIVFPPPVAAPRAFVRDVVTVLFTRPLLAQWWAQRTAEFLDRYDVSPADVDAARHTLVGYVALFLAGQTPDDLAVVPEARILHVSTLFLPALHAVFACRAVDDA